MLLASCNFFAWNKVFWIVDCFGEFLGNKLIRRSSVVCENEYFRKSIRKANNWEWRINHSLAWNFMSLGLVELLTVPFSNIAHLNNFIFKSVNVPLNESNQGSDYKISVYRVHQRTTPKLNIMHLSRKHISFSKAAAFELWTTRSF